MVRPGHAGCDRPCGGSCRSPCGEPGEAVQGSHRIGVPTCYKALASCGPKITFQRNSLYGIDPIGPYLRKGDLVLAFLKDSGQILEPVNPFAVEDLNWLREPIRNNPPPPGQGKEALQEDLAKGLESRSGAARLTTLEYLQGFRTFTPQVESTLQQIPPNQSLPFEERLSALATLLLSKPARPEYISMAATIARTEPEAIESHPRYASSVGHALAVPSSPAGLPSLIEIFHSSAELWHAGAMRAIRRLSDPKTVPILIQALDDPDPDAQYQAVMALCDITGKGADYGAGIVQFKKSPGRYTQLWKDWWQTEGKFRY